ncbi:MAG: hypothetical protein ACTHM6_05940 [Tepidisphaeraceae bacterium]
MIPPLKTIEYRGGVGSFRIPDNWHEEYEPAGGGMYYAPGEQTGTLRLNVTTARIPSDSPLFPANAQTVLSDFANEHGVVVRMLRPDVAMIRFDLPRVEQGQSIVIRSWQIAHAVSPADVRIALFTYTLLACQFDTPEAHDEMQLLEQELTAARFAAIVGTVQEQAKKSKPWWQFW